MLLLVSYTVLAWWALQYLISGIIGQLYMACDVTGESYPLCVVGQLYLITL